MSDVYSRGLGSVQVHMDSMHVHVLSAERLWPERTLVLGARYHRSERMGGAVFLVLVRDSMLISACIYLAFVATSSFSSDSAIF